MYGILTFMEQKQRKNIFNKIGIAIKDLFKRRDPLEFFIVLMSISLALYLISAIFFGVESLKSIFFRGCDDIFMDYFNQIRDVSQGSSVYTERHVIYPPMANLLFVISAQMVSQRYCNTVFERRMTWSYEPQNLIACLLFLGIFYALYLIVFSKYVPAKGKKKIATMFFVAVNASILYLLERGNMIIVCTVFTAIFLFTYDSENKIAREVGLLSLAFAFSIKLYPALFGALLIADKRYKEAIRCIIYALLMLIIPSFFFGGPKCIIYLFENFLGFSGSIMDMGKDIAPGGFMGKLFGFGVSLFKYAFILGLIAFVVGCFFIKERWKLFMYGIIAYNMVPALTSPYMWPVMLVPLLMFCKDNKLQGKNIFYFLMMLLPFLFIIFLPDKVLVYAITIVLYISLIVEVTNLVIKHFKKAKTTKTETTTQ